MRYFELQTRVPLGKLERGNVIGYFDDHIRAGACVAGTFPSRTVSCAKELRALLVLGEAPQTLGYCIDNEPVGARSVLNGDQYLIIKRIKRKYLNLLDGLILQ